MRTLILCVDMNRSTSAVDGASASGLCRETRREEVRRGSNRLMDSRDGGEPASQLSKNINSNEDT